MLLAEVKKLQSEFPDAVYKPDRDKWSGPTYGYTVGSAGNGVGCIVGQAWQRLGVSIEDVEELERELYDKPGANTTVSSMLSELGFGVDPNIEKLQKIQNNQDFNYKWGKC